VVAEARSWLGVSYRQKGRTGNGLDCIGLIVVVGQTLGVEHIDEQHYTDWPDPERRMIYTLDRYLNRTSADEPWDGTIGVFAQNGLPGHLGFFTTKHGVRHLVHAAMAHRRVLEEPYDNDPVTRKYRLIVRYRFPGLEG
jgi:hypothetical protein